MPELAKKLPSHLRRELLTVRLPQWMITQLKAKGEIGYFIEKLLGKQDILKPSDDYDINC